jgi:hypothetical protein
VRVRLRRVAPRVRRTSEACIALRCDAAVLIGLVAAGIASAATLARVTVAAARGHAVPARCALEAGLARCSRARRLARAVKAGIVHAHAAAGRCAVRVAVTLGRVRATGGVVPEEAMLHRAALALVRTRLPSAGLVVGAHRELRAAGVAPGPSRRAGAGRTAGGSRSRAIRAARGAQQDREPTRNAHGPREKQHTCRAEWLRLTQPGDARPLTVRRRASDAGVRRPQRR